MEDTQQTADRELRAEQLVSIGCHGEGNGGTQTKYHRDAQQEETQQTLIRIFKFFPHDGKVHPCALHKYIPQNKERFAAWAFAAEMNQGNTVAKAGYFWPCLTVHTRWESLAKPKLCVNTQ